MLPRPHITGSSWRSEPCPFNQSDHESWLLHLPRRGVLKDKPRFGSLFDFILTTAECTLCENTICEYVYISYRDVASPFLCKTLGAHWPLSSLSEGCRYHPLFRVLRPGSMPLPALGDTFCGDCYTSCRWTLGGGDQTIWLLCAGNEHQASHLHLNFRGLNQVCQFCTLDDIHRIHRLRSHDRHWFVFSLRRFFTIVIALALLVFLFTNLVLEPVQETGATPHKLYMAPMPSVSINDESVDDKNWSIIAVSEKIFQIWLLRMVITCHPAVC